MFEKVIFLPGVFIGFVSGYFLPITFRFSYYRASALLLNSKRTEWFSPTSIRFVSGLLGTCFALLGVLLLVVLPMGIVVKFAPATVNPILSFIMPLLLGGGLYRIKSEARNGK